MLVRVVPLVLPHDMAFMRGKRPGPSVLTSISVATQVFTLGRLQGFICLRCDVSHSIRSESAGDRDSSRVHVQSIQSKENRFMSKRESTLRDSGARNNTGAELVRSEAPSELLRELVAHLRQNRTQLREEWVVRITETRLLTAMTKEEIFAEATSVYD